MRKGMKSAVWALFVLLGLPLSDWRATAAGAGGAPLFVRGDANEDGRADVSDAVSVLLYLFSGGIEISCQRSADLDDSGVIEVTDGIWLLRYLFQAGPPPAEPFEACGGDSSDDTLTCREYAPCEFETLVASYDLLTTVAGKGEFRQRGLNTWVSQFEGGPAVEAELSRPHNAIADEAGNIYVADKDAHAVRKITPDGTITTVAGTNQAGDGADEPGPGTERALSSPNGLWVRGDGTVYILDLGNAKVRRLSPSGELTTLFTVSGGIIVGRGLWVHENEELAYLSSGTEVKRWIRGDGVKTHVDGFVELGNLIVDPRGRLVVTDRGGDRVYRIMARLAEGPPDSIPIAGNGSSFGGGDGAPALETGLDGVRGVWFLPERGYFVATHEGSDVWYVDSRGYIHVFLRGRADHSHTGDGEHFRSPGFKLSEVRAVSVDFDGNVLVTENDFGYVRKVHRRGG